MSLSIRAAAQAAADRTALLLEGRAYSFAALERLAACMAHRVLARANAERTERPLRIAFVAATDLPTIAAVHACWEMGWAPVLLHPRLSAEEHAALAEASAADLVLTPSDEAAHLSDASPPAWPEASARSAETVAAILFTSGTSGKPKGVVLSHRAFEASARASEKNLGWVDDDRWLLSLPLAHVGGLSILARTLLGRRTAAVATFRTRAPDEICERIARDRITIASFVPTMLHRVLTELPDYRFPPHVRAIFLGGAATSRALLLAAADRGVPVLTTYGLTEACSQVTTQAYGTEPDPDQGSGAPLDGLEVRIVEGEVRLRGATMMSGYLGPPGGELTSAFDADGWYATGDLGELDGAGRLHIRGRRSDRIITGGENVHPLEVEHVLEACEGVASACVFGVEDAAWGEIVAAAIVPRDPSAPVAELRARLSAYVRAELPTYRRPRKVAIVGQLALTSSGKLDRRSNARLVSLQLEPLPAPAEASG